MALETILRVKQVSGHNAKALDREQNMGGLRGKIAQFKATEITLVKCGGAITAWVQMLVLFLLPVTRLNF